MFTTNLVLRLIMRICSLDLQTTALEGHGQHHMTLLLSSYPIFGLHEATHIKFGKQTELDECQSRHVLSN